MLLSNIKLTMHKIQIRKTKEYMKRIKRLKAIANKYWPSIQMIQLLNNSIKIEQPGSLNQSYFYQFDKNKKYQFTKLLNHIYIILNNFFATFNGLISKPVYLFTQNKLTIYINYFLPVYIFWDKKRQRYIITHKKLIARNYWKYNKFPAQTAIELKLELTKLIKVISNLLSLSTSSYNQNNNTLNENSGIKVELQLNQLKFPYHDSTILSKFIALSTNKKRFRRIFNTIIKKASVITKEIIRNKHFSTADTKGRKLKFHNSIPAVLTGLKVQISGRLITERIIPKRTVTKKEIGAFNRTKDSIVDYALYTNKNKRGSYTVKVWTTSKICV